MVNPSLMLFVVLQIVLVRALVWTAIERRHPAYEVRYREVIWGDLVAAMLVIVICQGAAFVNYWFSIKPAIPASVMQLPVICRFLLYTVIADFGHYWIHRLIHAPALWRIHKWHHSPTYMYWLAGIRTSLPQQILINIPYILAGSLLDFSWPWLSVIIFTKNNVENDWMHLNVRWGSRLLEWFIVTPRYHHVHHSDKPEHYGANLASLFTIWDRLFGTYVDPETLPERPKFGIGEQLPVIRLALGI
jgi:sterol desaturase/sphingolipid hydroxylase (fatty acid hydroxylase superfamily)